MASSNSNTEKKTTAKRRGRSPAIEPEAAADDSADNVVLVAGRVRVEPVVRSLPSDETLLTFDLVSGVGSELRTVPVSWQGPPRSIPKVAPDDAIVVLGTVQRRFFRAGGATAHAVDVRADLVARTPAAKRRLIATAVARLESVG